MGRDNTREGNPSNLSSFYNLIISICCITGKGFYISLDLLIDQAKFNTAKSKFLIWHDMAAFLCTHKILGPRN